MIDLTSTREETDPQTRACARLLTAVIAQAIRDACTPMTSTEKREHRNLDANATEAIRWLFNPDSAFTLYAQLIGSSADSIRAALLEKADSLAPVTHAFTDMDRRILQGRLRWQEAL